MHGFSGPLGLKWRFGGQNTGTGGAILTRNELILPFRGSYVCANFGENRSRNTTVRVLTDGQIHTHTHTMTDANRFYNLSHAICYSYGTDKILTASFSCGTVYIETGSVCETVRCALQAMCCITQLTQNVVRQTGSLKLLTMTVCQPPYMTFNLTPLITSRSPLVTKLVMDHYHQP